MEHLLEGMASPTMKDRISAVDDLQVRRTYRRSATSRWNHDYHIISSGLVLFSNGVE